MAKTSAEMTPAYSLGPGAPRPTTTGFQIPREKGPVTQNHTSARPAQRALWFLKCAVFFLRFPFRGIHPQETGILRPRPSPAPRRGAARGCRAPPHRPTPRARFSANLSQPPAPPGPRRPHHRQTPEEPPGFSGGGFPMLKPTSSPAPALLSPTGPILSSARQGAQQQVGPCVLPAQA